jgi:anti-sigma regulatory factor (Ser/Thr protein kinase)
VTASNLPEPAPERADEVPEPTLQSAPEPAQVQPTLQSAPEPAQVQRTLQPAAELPQGEPVAAERALSLAVSPVTSALAAARDTVRAFLRGFSVPERTVFDVVLSLEEACKNAIRFSGSDCAIDVTVAMHADEVRLVIRDHGVGFEPRHIDVSRPPDPLDPQGRGLFLMSCLMDDVRIDCDQGAIVSASKTVAR